MSILKIIGDIRTVLAGNVTDSSLHSLEKPPFRFGLGGGTTTGIKGIGETILWEGKPTISYGDTKHLTTLSSSQFSTPFLMGIDEVAGPQKTERKTLSFEAFYSQLIGSFQQGCVIIGEVHFTKADLIYLLKAPIYHENVLTNKDAYWSKPTGDKNVTAHFFGVLVPSTARKNYPDVERALYHHPLDTKTSHDSHTHVLLKVGGARHLLTTSTFDVITYSVLPLEKIEIISLSSS